MQKKSIYFFMGTNAELIKLAPIIKEFKKRKVYFKIITSGQNTIYFQHLMGFVGNIKPDISFKEKINKSSVFHFIFWAFRTFLFSPFLLSKEFKGLDKDNSYLLIHGDTISSTMGALLSKIFDLKLVHIESGDLSFNSLEPFPEEVCRNINIRLADILFAPNEWARGNLKNIQGIKINTYYNTLVETFLWTKLKYKSKINIKQFKKYYILFMRRQEHVVFRKSWSKKILEFVIENSNPSLNCLIIDNPLVVELIKSLKINSDQKIKKRIKLISPLPYPDFMKLMNGAEFIATDGCTNQLESYLLGKPCLVLRNLTEQIEGLGRNVVICKGNKNIIRDFLKNYQKYKTKSIITLKVRPAKVIVDYLVNH